MSSSSTTSERWLLCAGVAGALALGATGCGLQPGDYVVYRVSASTETRSAGCYYPTFVVPIDDAEDTSTYLDTDTFVLYLGTPEEPYLDAGAFALAGTETDEGYSFSGRDIDVTYLGAANDIRETETTEIELEMIRDGRTITGTSTRTLIPRCEWVTAAPAVDLCPDPPRQTCVQTVDFEGVELDDVELDYGVEGGAAPVPGP